MPSSKGKGPFEEFLSLKKKKKNFCNCDMFILSILLLTFDFKNDTEKFSYYKKFTIKNRSGGYSTIIVD